MCLVVGLEVKEGMYRVGYSMSEQDRKYDYVVYTGLVCGKGDMMIEIDSARFNLWNEFTVTKINGKQAKELTGTEL